MEVFSFFLFGFQEVEILFYKEEFREFFFREFDQFIRKVLGLKFNGRVILQYIGGFRFNVQYWGGGGEGRKLLIWGCFDYILGGRNVFQLVE